MLGWNMTDRFLMNNPSHCVNYYNDNAAAQGDIFTQFHFSLQGEKNVSGFQVSVDDLVLVEVNQGLQGLPTHNTDLWLCQGPLQFCG